MATVIAISGQAWARDEDGNLRELRIGDVIQEGETLITSADGRVELDFADGTGANVVEGGQEVAVTPELNTDAIVATDASAQDDDLEALLAALEDEDGDLLDLLDATAAGAGAGGGGGGGSGGGGGQRGCGSRQRKAVTLPRADQQDQSEYAQVTPQHQQT